MDHPHEQLIPDGSPERLERLQRVFLAVADRDEAGAALAAEYFSNGGSLRECLYEIEVIAGPSDFDKQIAQSRDSYMAVVLTRPTLRNRLTRKQLLAQQETAYLDAVINKIAAVVDAQTGTEILAVRQLPALVQRTKFSDKAALELENIAACHLFVLLDTALQEHDLRRRAIAEHQRASLRARITGNRVLHLAVAGGIFGASFVPELGIVPTPDEIITSDIETGLKLVSGAIFGLDAPELIRLRILQHQHDKQTKQLEEQLAESRELTDLACRTVYSASRYGSSKSPETRVTGRYGTDDPAHNLALMQSMDAELEHLHSDPGGRPYSASQALGYASRFLIDRHDETIALGADLGDPAASRSRYLQYCREILVEDLARMKQGLTITRYRKEFMKMLGVIPALVLPSFTAGINDASSLSQDAVRVLNEDNDSERRRESNT